MRPSHSRVLPQTFAFTRQTPARLPIRPPVLHSPGTTILPFQQHQGRGQHQIMASSSSSASNRRPSFGDSAYFPPGWDRERLLSASTSDLRDLPAEEFDKLRAGMIDKMGVADYQRWVGLLSSGRPSSARQPATTTDSGVPKAPRYLTSGAMRWGPKGSDDHWGFVVFKTAGYDLSQEQWEDIERRVEKAILAPLEPYLSDEGIRDAKERFRLVWVEDKQSLEASEPRRVAEAFGNLVEEGKVPAGLDRALCCLCFDSEVLKLIQTPPTSPEPMIGQLTRIRVVGPEFRPEAPDSPQEDIHDDDVVSGYVPLEFVLSENGLFHLVAKGVLELKEVLGLQEKS